MGVALGDSALFRRGWELPGTQRWPSCGFHTLGGLCLSPAVGVGIHGLGGFLSVCSVFEKGAKFPRQACALELSCLSFPSARGTGLGHCIWLSFAILLFKGLFYYFILLCV